MRSGAGRGAELPDGTLSPDVTWLTGIADDTNAIGSHRKLTRAQTPFASLGKIKDLHRAVTGPPGLDACEG